ncbi:helix-turn-helix transcriptional regulator [Roseibium algae]|uniref:YafY family protein n=1 Tax=Roseibium algae TaxID=3123038 RepID=A0ABU8TRD7_9HYPH
MKASRLLSILTILQARGRVTAQTLSDECEVSLRTIYRDIDALSLAGIPVYSERGSEGGYRLLDGYRTQLNGLSAAEADTLFLTGLPGPAADLGLGAVMAAAQNKLLAALPEAIRQNAEQYQNRFHLDAPAWFSEAEHPAHLPEIANAIRDQRQIEILYRSWKAEKCRCVSPLGIVLKSGTWYLAGTIEGAVRTYRISRILKLKTLEATFERPEKFHLASYWNENTRRLEEELHPTKVVVRLSPYGNKLFEALVPPYVRTSAVYDQQPDDAGWLRATIQTGSIRQTCVDLMRFGCDIEVLEPEELRTAMREEAQKLVKLYGAEPSDPAQQQPANHKHHFAHQNTNDHTLPSRKK